MPAKAIPADLETELARLEAWALAPAATADQLHRNFSSVYEALHGLELSRYDMVRLADDAPRLIRSLFQARMHLRERISEWHANGLMSREVQHALRNLLRATRYASDMLGELAIDFRRFNEGATPLVAFRGRDNNTLINPRFDRKADLPFESGDILLVRGRHHNSAAIARIGDVDSQYSHVGIVYVDPKGYHWIVEVLIEVGGVIKPLEEALAHDLGRAILFRHRDPALAQRAAYIAHEHVKQSLSRYGKPIHYDFTMQPDGGKRMFCSKLARFAFDKASEGAVKLPTFPSRLEMKNRDFFDRIGVTAVETFGPGDMELEPDFDIVAEWQDYRVTAWLRDQDMTMDKLFEWMDTKGLVFKETFLVNVISRLGRIAAGFSDTIKTMISDVVPQVPPHMPRKTIATIVMLHKTADPVMHEIEEVERERIKVFGHPLHPREVREYLDRMFERMGGEIGYLSPRS